MIAYIGLGSNLNQPKNQLKTALNSLDIHQDITLLEVSEYHEYSALLAPENPDPQPNYFNAVAKIKTYLPPIELLDECQKIEQQQHRVRTKKWSARTIDLDILLIDDCVIEQERLTIPHPQMHKRDFVLKPLSEISPDLMIPKLGALSALLVKIN